MRAHVHALHVTPPQDEPSHCVLGPKSESLTPRPVTTAKAGKGIMSASPPLPSPLPPSHMPTSRHTHCPPPLHPPSTPCTTHGHSCCITCVPHAACHTCTACPNCHQPPACTASASAPGCTRPGGACPRPPCDVTHTVPHGHTQNAPHTVTRPTQNARHHTLQRRAHYAVPPPHIWAQVVVGRLGLCVWHCPKVACRCVSTVAEGGL